jgi:PTH1 family peptidyl-tRNA hydrolase
LKIIVGLGNPGERYAATRHNIGFRCANLLAKRYSLEFSDKKGKALIAVGGMEGQRVALAKPRTFMNNSGEGVKYLLERFGATSADLIVIYDDMDLPLGAIRVRGGGSGGGHKGIGSIMQATGTQEVTRVRVGIGRPPEGTDSVEYVLSAFLPDEQAKVEQALAQAADAVALVLREGVEAAMGRYNTRGAVSNGQK